MPVDSHSYVKSVDSAPRIERFSLAMALNAHPTALCSRAFRGGRGTWVKLRQSAHEAGSMRQSRRYKKVNY